MVFWPSAAILCRYSWMGWILLKSGHKNWGFSGTCRAYGHCALCGHNFRFDWWQKRRMSRWLAVFSRERVGGENVHWKIRKRPDYTPTELKSVLFFAEPIVQHIERSPEGGYFCLLLEIGKAARTDEQGQWGHWLSVWIPTTLYVWHSPECARKTRYELTHSSKMVAHFIPMAAQFESREINSGGCRWNQLTEQPVKANG